MSTALYDTAPHDAAPQDAAPRNGAHQRSGHRRGRPRSAPGDFAPRIYRGRSVEELIPRIVSELGEDAVVIRHHRGLTGGFAGFFQRPLVEIEARRGVPGIDRYDEDEAAPALPDDEAFAPPGGEAFAPPGGEAFAPPGGEAFAPPGGEAFAPPGGEAFAPPGGEAFAPPGGEAFAPPGGEAFAPPGGGAFALPHDEASALLRDEAFAPPGGERSALPAELEDPRAAPVPAPEQWGAPRQIWATNPFAAALAEAEAAVRAAEPAVPPDLDAALAEALAEAEEAGVPAGSGELELPAEMFPPPPDDLYAEPPERLAEAADAEVPVEPPAVVLPTAPPVYTHASDDIGERDEIERTLLGVGIGGEFMQELIERAIAHVLTLMPASTSLAQAVRTALAQMIPVCPPLPAAGGTIAVVGAGGSGKSAFCAALLDAYREHGALPAICAKIGPESPHPTSQESGPRNGWAGCLQLLDTPPVSCADPDSIGALAELLAPLAPDRVVLALPATLGATPAAQLLEALSPLGASALAITHADETDQLGVAVQAACTFGLAPIHLLARTERGCAEGGLTWIDPWLLVDRLLPPR